MITEQQQEQASIYALGALPLAEQSAFEVEVRANAELREFVFEMQSTAGVLAKSLPVVPLPPELRDKVLRAVEKTSARAEHRLSPPPAVVDPLRFVMAGEQRGWKELPIPGAWIKLLSLERERGYAVLLGKLDPGVRYPAHTNVSAEDFCILTGDLHVSGQRLGPGDFHHADAGSEHGVNYSVEGCTLISVLAADHPLVELAMS